MKNFTGHNFCLKNPFWGGLSCFFLLTYGCTEFIKPDESRLEDISKKNSHTSSVNQLQTSPISGNTIEELKMGIVKIKVEIGGIRRVGTGIIVGLDKDAVHIVTASHVVQGGGNPKIIFYSAPFEEFTGNVLSMESNNEKGLAALLLKGPLPFKIRSLYLDKETKLKGGESVTIIGFPTIAGTPWAVTSGTIAGRKGGELTFSGPIEEGNSGGPLLIDGKVVGIITQMAGPFGYAIPAITAHYTLEGWGLDNIAPVLRQNKVQTEYLPDNPTEISSANVTSFIPQGTHSSQKTRAIPCIPEKELLVAIKAGENTSYSTTRDSLYTKIVGQALCSPNFDLAILTATKISYSTTRDEAFMEIIKVMIKAREFDLAEQTSAKISYSSTRDEAKEQIIEALTKQ